MASEKWQRGCDELCGVLRGHLQSTGCFLPAGDNITIEDVLNLYDSAMGRRRVPDREKLLHRHPDLAEYIDFYFAPK